MTGTLHEGRYTLTISRWILLRMRSISDNICWENQTCRLWDNVGGKKSVELDRPKNENKTRHMRFACWINKAINTHSWYEIFVGFLSKNSCMKAPQFHVTCTRPVLSKTSLLSSIPFSSLPIVHHVPAGSSSFVWLYQ